MDPVCHTLVGAAIGETGLKHRSRLGLATLVIAANLPDIDVLSLVAGPVTALGFRRGWTHGATAILLLPLALVGLVMLWDRLGRVRHPSLDPVRPKQLVLLAYVGMITHPTLDFMNVYGMRWLMPFVDRWRYGDVLFIIDPWIWAALAAGVYLSRRRWRDDHPTAGRPAVAALAGVAAYIGIMAVAGSAARRMVTAELPRHGVSASARLMVAPVPVDPFRRLIVVEDSSGYRFGTFHWLSTPRVELHNTYIPRNDRLPAALRAAATEQGRTFLHWARFPFFVVSPGADSSVYIVDARYTLDENAGFGAVLIGDGRVESGN